MNQIQQIRKSMTVTERETTYQHLIGAARNDWEDAYEMLSRALLGNEGEISGRVDELRRREEYTRIFLSSLEDQAKEDGVTP